MSNPRNNLLQQYTLQDLVDTVISKLSELTDSQVDQLAFLAESEIIDRTETKKFDGESQ